MKIIHSRWTLFLKSFGFLLPTLLVASFALFYCVLILFGGIVFGLNDSPIWLMLGFRGVNFREIIEAPNIYLSSISLVSSLVGASWIAFVAPRFSRFTFLQILIVPWIAVILTGPVWGLIWSVNHWPAEGFASYETMMLFRKTDVENGLYLSWLSAAQSFPLNLFSYLAYCGLLAMNKRLFLRNEENKN
jgi:hypothetical protein